MLLRHAFFVSDDSSFPSLFEDLFHRTANPDLGLFQPENVGNRGSAIELHHALFKFIAFLDAFSCNDEGGFHLLHRLSAVPFLYSAVVCGNDENRFVRHACLIDRLNNLTDVAIQFVQFLVILRRVVSHAMPYMVRFVKNNVDQRRMRLPDILNRAACRRRILRFLRNVIVISQRKCIHHIADECPLANVSNLRIRSRLAQEAENGRENAMRIHHPRRQFGRLRTPFRISVQLRPRAHIHRSPVHRAGRRQNRTLLQRITSRPNRLTPRVLLSISQPAKHWQLPSGMPAPKSILLFSFVCFLLLCSFIYGTNIVKIRTKGFRFTCEKAAANNLRFLLFGKNEYFCEFLMLNR